jgi:hypothetical protein
VRQETRPAAEEQAVMPDLKLAGVDVQTEQPHLKVVWMAPRPALSAKMGFVLNNLEIGLLICRLLSIHDIDKLRRELDRLDYNSWILINNLAESYNLISLLYFKLYNNNLIKSLPPDILRGFQNDFNDASRNALKRHFEIKSILKLLSKSNVEAILLKGIYIAGAYYENSATRPMCDIDLLIKQEDIQKTVNILKAAGYTAETQGKGSNSQDFINNLDSLRKFTKHVAELKTPKGIPLEIHFALDYDNENSKTNIDIEKIWDTKEPAQVYGTTSYGMKTELLLLYLCINIAEDCFKQKILQLYDIFLIISKIKIKWDFLITQAKEWNCQKALHAVLVAEYKLFNLKIPDPIFRELNLATDCTEEIHDIVIGSIFADLDIAEQYEDKIGNEFSAKSMKDKFRLFYWSFWSKDKIFYHYGVEKGVFNVFLCRIKRTIYLLKKYLISFLYLYIINPGKKNKIKKQNINSYKALDNWLKKE